MEALLVLLLIFLAVVLFIFPLWAFIKIGAHRDELDALRTELSDLREELRRRPVPPGHATATPAPATVAAAPAQEEPPPSPTPAAPVSMTAAVTKPPPAPLSPAQPTPVVAPLPEPPPLPPMAAPTPARPSLPDEPSRPAAPAFNWEQFMGVKLFAWLGGFALFLGAVFFIKLSIEQGWIPPEVRVALGFLLGLGLVAGGSVLSRKRYAVTAQTLCATGIVILYAVTFACRAFYHFPFFGIFPTFALMALITTAAFLLAVRMDAKVVALLGMLGGFLTPILVSTGQDNPLGLFTYIGLLDLGLLAVALHRRWNFLLPLAALGTALMQLGWAGRFLGADNTFTAMVVCVAFNALFLVGLLLARRRDDDVSLALGSFAAIALVAFGFAGYLATQTPAGLQPARWLAFVFLIDVGVLIAAARHRPAAGLHLFSGMIVFGLLALWTYSRLRPELLPWALASYLIFAVLHSAFPLYLQRIDPEAVVGSWSSLFAPLALLIVLGPVLNSSFAGTAIWPAILLLDLLAITLAWVTGSLLGVVAVLVLTLFAAGQWLFRLPTGQTGGFFLVIVAGFSILFCAAGLLLARRFRSLAGSLGESSADARAALPILSSLLPFVLLVMASQRLPVSTPSSLFGLALLLAVMALGLARWLGQGLLPGCALAGVLAVNYAWHVRAYSPGSPVLPLVWYGGFYALFTVFPFLFHQTFREARAPWITSALAGPLVFPLFFGVAKTAWPSFPRALLAVGFALPMLAALVRLVRQDPPDHPRRVGRLALYGGVALLFITLVFPLQFERQWLTISWAMEGVALLWLWGRVPHRGLPAVATALLLIAFARLALNPEVLSYGAGPSARIFNVYLYTYGTVVVCLFAAARLTAAVEDRIFGVTAPGWFNALGTILLFLLVNIEIADFFGGRVSGLKLEFSGNFARDLSYTVAWGLFAFGLLVVGIWRHARAARYAAITLLGATLLKLFLHDLAQLDRLYRVAALVVVAVIAFLASFLYQRFVPADEKKPPSAP